MNGKARNSKSQNCKQTVNKHTNLLTFGDNCVIIVSERGKENLSTNPREREVSHEVSYG